MKTRLIVSTLLLSGSILYPQHALWAAEAPKADTPLSKLEVATVEIMKGMDENEAKQFSAINNSFGIIRTVENVQQSISLAVESCSKNNPDLKEGMSARFEAWKEEIRPVVKKARNKMDKMVLMQSFATPSEVRAYLKKFDAAIIYRNQKLKPVPIESAEDCTKLQKSMDKTQPDTVKLMTEALHLDADLKIKE